MSDNDVDGLHRFPYPEQPAARWDGPGASYAKLAPEGLANVYWWFFSL